MGYSHACMYVPAPINSRGAPESYPGYSSTHVFRVKACHTHNLTVIQTACIQIEWTLSSNTCTVYTICNNFMIYSDFVLSNSVAGWVAWLKRLYILFVFYFSLFVYDSTASGLIKVGCINIRLLFSIICILGRTCICMCLCFEEFISYTNTEKPFPLKVNILLKIQCATLFSLCF